MNTPLYVSVFSKLIFRACNSNIEIEFLPLARTPVQFFACIETGNIGIYRVFIIVSVYRITVSR